MGDWCRRGEGEVIFTIEISECAADPSLYQCTIYDNCPLTDSRIRDLVYAQNSRLNKSILNERNALREGDWGLIEMDISAAYLRKINIEDIDTARYDIPLSPEEAEAFATDSGRERALIFRAVKKGQFLAYRMHLPKPKEILIMDESGERWKERFYRNGIPDREALEGLGRNGILWLHGLDEPAISLWKMKGNTSYPQQLVLLLGPAHAVKSNYVPQRVISLAALMDSIAGFPSESIHEAAAAFPAGSIPDDTAAFLWNLMHRDKGRAFIAAAWRCLVSRKMREKGITELKPRHNYTRFVHKQENDAHVLKVGLDYHEEAIDSALECNDYYEGYNYLTKDLIGRINPYEEGDKLKEGFDYKELFSFMEGVLTNVLILDERVQQYFYSTLHPRINMTVGAIASKSFIYCPEPGTIDLNRQSFDKVIRKKLTAYLKIQAEHQKLKGLEIIVIHLGIIEKILKSEYRQKNKEDISAFVKDLKRRSADIFGNEPFVVITSGRGKPENLPEDLPFIGYSILSQFAIESRSKSLLTQALYAARPKN